ncbi:MAG TPA: translation initiation factor IF-2 N-terminal domain-containing protein, partial [Polyangiaceae bacterium]|nr:translation initiation factor IF-2 N-terminal domain-containing protein [Polyangiaceae bacterium]
MSKVRVYEVARDLNVDQDHLVGVLQSLGFSDVRNRMSKVDADAVERVRRHIESQQRTPEVVQERLSDTVIRRRRVGAPTRPSSSAAPVGTAPVVEMEKRPDPPVRKRKVAEKAVAPPTDAASEKAPDLVEKPAVPVEPVSDSVAETASGSGVDPTVDGSAEPVIEEVVESSAVKTAETPVDESVEPSFDKPLETATAPSVITELPATVTKQAVEKEQGEHVSEAASQEPEAVAPVVAPDKEPVAQPGPSVVEHIVEPTPLTLDTPRDIAVAAWLAGEPLVGEPVKASKEAAPAVVEPSKTVEAAPESAVSEKTTVEPREEISAAVQDTVSALTSEVPDVGLVQERSDIVPSVSKESEEPFVERSEERESHRELAGEDESAGEEPVVTTKLSQDAPTRVPVRPASPTRVAPPVPQPPVRTQQHRTGIDVWEGRPGVPMRQPPQPRPSTTPASPVRRREYDPRAASPATKTETRTTANRRTWAAGRGKRGVAAPVPSKKPVATKEMSEHKKIIKIEAQVSLQALAARMSLKATEVLMKLMSMGLPGVNINSTLDADTAKLVASEFGWEVEDVAVSEEEALNLARDEADEDTANLE